MVMPLYLFSVLAALVNILQQIKAIQRKFIWGRVRREKKWALVARDKICTPKSRGGLGIKDPLTIGRAFAAKIFLH